MLVHRRVTLSIKLTGTHLYTWAERHILVPGGLAPFGEHQKSRPLARSRDIPVLNGFVNTNDWDQNQSDLSDLTLSMRRVMGSPWITDFRCWTRLEVIQWSNERACLSHAARVGLDCTISIEKSKWQNGGRFKFRGICFHFAGIRRKQNS